MLRDFLCLIVFCFTIQESFGLRPIYLKCSLKQSLNESLSCSINEIIYIQKYKIESGLNNKTLSGSLSGCYTPNDTKCSSSFPQDRYKLQMHLASACNLKNACGIKPMLIDIEQEVKEKICHKPHGLKQAKFGHSLGYFCISETNQVSMLKENIAHTNHSLVYLKSSNYEGECICNITGLVSLISIMESYYTSFNISSGETLRKGSEKDWVYDMDVDIKSKKDVCIHTRSHLNGRFLVKVEGDFRYNCTCKRKNKPPLANDRRNSHQHKNTREPWDRGIRKTTSKNESVYRTSRSPKPKEKIATAAAITINQWNVITDNVSSKSGMEKFQYQGKTSNDTMNSHQQKASTGVWDDGMTKRTSNYKTKYRPSGSPTMKEKIATTTSITIYQGNVITDDGFSKSEMANPQNQTKTSRNEVGTEKYIIYIMAGIILLGLIFVVISIMQRRKEKDTLKMILNRIEAMPYQVPMLTTAMSPHDEVLTNTTCQQMIEDIHVKKNETNEDGKLTDVYSLAKRQGSPPKPSVDSTCIYELQKIPN